MKKTNQKKSPIPPRRVYDFLPNGIHYPRNAQRESWSDIFYGLWTR